MDESKVIYSVLESIYFWPIYLVCVATASLCSFMSVCSLGRASCSRGSAQTWLMLHFLGTRGVSVMFNTSWESRRLVAGKSIGCLVTQSFWKAKPHSHLSKERRGLGCLCIRSEECPIKTGCCKGCYLLREMSYWNQQGLCSLLWERRWMKAGSRF